LPQPVMAASASAESEVDKEAAFIAVSSSDGATVRCR